MRHPLILLLLLLAPFFIQAQLINFQLISIDTNQSIQQETSVNGQIIANSAAFREVFYRNKYTINQPRFHQTIFLKRSIQEDCLQSIDNTVTIDSLEQTITWLTTLERGICNGKKTRQLVIAVPKPPPHFSIIFDTLWVDVETEPSEQEITEVPFNGFSCKLTRTAGLPFYPLPAIITTDSLYLKYKLGDALDCTQPIDFGSDMIIANSYGGDCLMQLMPHSFYDPLTNTLVVDVYNIYGGCRAGGWKPTVAIVPKPQREKFNVLFQEIQLETWAEYETYMKN